jgi:predicted Zn-ribbon and HTH transcriptional regulator
MAGMKVTMENLPIITKKIMTDAKSLEIKNADYTMCGFRFGKEGVYRPNAVNKLENCVNNPAKYGDTFVTIA